MLEKAVIDRIVDGRKAVLLVGEREAEHILDIEKLPKEVREGDWLQVEFEGSNIVKIAADNAETEKVKKRIKEKMTKLKQKSGSKFRK